MRFCRRIGTQIDQKGTKHTNISMYKRKPVCNFSGPDYFQKFFYVKYCSLDWEPELLEKSAGKTVSEPCLFAT